MDVGRSLGWGVLIIFPREADAGPHRVTRIETARQRRVILQQQAQYRSQPWTPVQQCSSESLNLTRKAAHPREKAVCRSAGSPAPRGPRGASIGHPSHVSVSSHEAAVQSRSALGSAGGWRGGRTERWWRAPWREGVSSPAEGCARLSTPTPPPDSPRTSRRAQCGAASGACSTACAPARSGPWLPPPPSWPSAARSSRGRCCGGPAGGAGAGGALRGSGASGWSGAGGAGGRLTAAGLFGPLRSRALLTAWAGRHPSTPHHAQPSSIVGGKRRRGLRLVPLPGT